MSENLSQVNPQINEQNSAKNSKQSATKTIIFSILGVFVVVAVIATYFAYTLFQTGNEVTKTVNANTAIYSDLLENSTEYQLSFKNFLTDSSDVKTTEQVENLLTELSQYKAKNDEIVTAFNAKSNEKFQETPNNDTKVYAENSKNFVQSGAPLFTKVGSILTATECMLNKQKGIITAQEELAALGQLDTSTTQAAIAGLEKLAGVTKKAQTEVDGLTACFDGQFSELRDDIFIDEMSKLSTVFADMTTYINQMIEGVKTQNVAKIEKASTDLTGLESRLNNIDAKAAGDSLEKTISNSFQNEAEAFNTATSNLKSTENSLRKTYQIY